jgi:hypothetical protein
MKLIGRKKTIKKMRSTYDSGEDEGEDEDESDTRRRVSTD